MNVLFLSVNDLKDSRYRREGKRNLLDTKFGTADTLAFCGRLESAKKTKYGPRLEINDANPLTVIVGTFNSNVRKDAEKIVEKFKNEKGLYLLIHGNPYETDQLYINVNQDNGVILVDRETYEKFHELRKDAGKYLLEKLGTTTKLFFQKEAQNSFGILAPKTAKQFCGNLDQKKGIREANSVNSSPEKLGTTIEEKKTEEEPPSELSNSKIMNFIKSKDKKEGVRMEEILAHFKNFDGVEEKILELMEIGELYEPKAGLLKVLE